MEIRSLRIPGSETAQTFYSRCLSEVIRLRLNLELDSRTDTSYDNLMNAHLAQVLTLGAIPSEAAWKVLAQGLSVADEYIHLAPNRIAHYNRCLDIGPTALYLHSQRLYAIGCGRGRWQRDLNFGRDMLMRIGRDSYLGASLSMTTDRQLVTSVVDDLFSSENEFLSLAEIWSALAEYFLQYSAFLHQVGIDMGFIEGLPPSLLRP